MARLIGKDEKLLSLGAKLDNTFNLSRDIGYAHLFINSNAELKGSKQAATGVAGIF